MAYLGNTIVNGLLRAINGIYASGDCNISGTLTLSKDTDTAGAANNKPALIVGGTDTTAHIEIDGNEIMAKSSGTATGPLYLNNDGGNVYVNNKLVSLDGHIHSYLPLTGGTLTNQLIVQTTSYGNFNQGIRINKSGNGYATFMLGGNAGTTGGNASANGGWQIEVNSGNQLFVSNSTSANTTSSAFWIDTDKKVTMTGACNVVGSLTQNGTAVSLSNHTHNYAGSSSAGGAANSIVTSSVTANAAKDIYFANAANTVGYNDNFTYNPSLGLLKVPSIASTNTRQLAFVDGGYYTGDGTITGAICITLPVSWTATMLSFHVTIYNYVENDSTEYFIYGYNYSGGSGSWVNTSAHAIGKRILNVRFGHNGSKCCVTIGETNTSWSYPKVCISNVCLGHSSPEVENWNKGWNISVVTTLPSTINKTTNPADNLTRVATTSLPGFMSAADKTKLDGIASGANAYTHPNTVTAGTIGTSSATSGSTLAVPYITYNANGHITATGTHTHTVSGFLPLSGGTMTGTITRTGSQTYLASQTAAALTINNTDGYMGWVCGKTKNGNIAIASHSGSDDNLMFLYGVAGRTANGYDQAMTWNGSENKLSVSSISVTNINNVAVGSSPKFTDTTYSANNGVGLSGTTFYNSGVRSIATGSANGTISVNTNGTAADVAVKGLGTAAYTSIDSALSSSSTNSVQNKVINAALDNKIDVSNGFINEDISWDLNAFYNHRIYESKLDNTLYAADKRFTVTLTNVSGSASNLFDGNVESTCIIAAGVTGTILIDGTINLGMSYPYGRIAMSFYYTSCPTKEDGASNITLRVYQNWPDHNVGWVTLPVSKILYTGNNVATIIWTNSSTYNIYKMEFTINNTAGKTVANPNGSGSILVGSIEYFSNRTSINTLPVLTKWGNDTKYGNLSLSGGTFVGNLTGNVTGNCSGSSTKVQANPAAGATADLVYSQMGANDYFRIRTGGDSNAGYAELATADDGTEPIYVRQYTGIFSSLVRTATLLDGSGNTSFPGSLTANSIDATKLSGTIPAACYTDTKYTHPNTVTAGTVGTSSATSGSTLAVPYITYNANGHVTATGTHTHTISGFLPSTGGTLTNQLIIQATTSGSYNEGIRINKAGNNWAGMVIGSNANSTSGAPSASGGWFVAQNTANQFLINNVDSGTGNASLWINTDKTVNIGKASIANGTVTGNLTLNGTNGTNYLQLPSGIKLY